MGDRVTRIRRVGAALVGPTAAQFVCIVMALAGVFLLFGLGVFLIVGGVTGLAWSILAEAGWI